MNTQPSHLSRIERSGFAVGAVICLLAAWLAALNPTRLESRELDGAGKVIKVTTSEQSRTELTVLFSAVGIVFLFLGLNGIRLSKFSVGSVSAESRSPEVKAADESAREKEKIKEVVAAEEPAVAETQPEKAPEGKAILGDAALSVFSREAVPERVFQDALNSWPAELERPTDLSALEFAARRTGQGNFPWILKFKDTPPIRVSYGRPTGGATVRADG